MPRLEIKNIEFMEILEGTMRKKIGSRSALKKARGSGLIPAIVYGKEIGSLPIFLKQKDLEKIYPKVGESEMINLKISSRNKEYRVLIKEVQRNPLKENFLHVDLYQLPETGKIEVTVPLVFEGQAPAVKEKGAVLIKNIREIKVKALAKDLPSKIKVDLTSLKDVSSAIKIKDLALPPEFEVLARKDEIVALAQRPEEEILKEVPSEEKLSEVEVIGKKEKREGEKENLK